MTAKDLPGSEPDVTYAYDLLGRTTATASQTLSFTWDALGRNLTQVGPQGTVTSTWDIAGRRTRLTWPDAFYVTYDYLITGEMTKIRENGAASGIGVIGSLAYDNLGRRTSLTLGNGVATTYTYDPVSRLNELKLEFAGTTDDLTSGFTYNPASQIASNARSNDAYAWISHGSGTTTTTSNGLNQIGSWVTSLVHDTKGNITTDGTYTYGYSSENLLTSLANSASGAIQTSSTYAYDPLMRLAVIDSSNSALDASLGYDGQDFILEGLSGSRTRRYVRGPGVDEPLVAYLMTSTGTSRLWYQADERGSIVRHSNDSGTPGLIGKYDEYGVGGTGRIRYAGQYWLADGNLIYSRARIYDARLGRFLQPDPIGYGDGMNMYAYSVGDPINLTDPSGTSSIGPGTCAVVTGSRIPKCGSDLQGALAGVGIWVDLESSKNLKNEGRATSAAACAAEIAACFQPVHLATPAALTVGFHYYTEGPNVICGAAYDCSRSEIAAVYTMANNQIPGAPAEPIVSGSEYSVYVYGIFIGRVTSTVSQGGLAVVNQAYAFHLFGGPTGGQVARAAYLGKDGTWYSYTEGVGSNWNQALAALNQLFAPSTWRAQDRQIRRQLEGPVGRR